MLYHNKVTIVTIGDIEPENDLLQYVEILTDSKNFAKGLIIGRIVNDQYEKKLKKAIESSGLEVDFRESISDGELEDCYAALFTPTENDLSLECLRAMSLGLPVVARQTRNVHKCISYENDGFLYANKSWASYNLRRLITDEKLAKDIGEKAKGRKKQYEGLKKKPRVEPIDRSVSGRIKVFIISYNNPKCVDTIYNHLSSVFDVSVFDNGSDPDKIPDTVTHRFENLYYTGSWNKAMQMFGNYDILWGLTDDIVLKNSAAAYYQAIEEAMPFGCWSSAVGGCTHEFMNVSKCRKGVYQVINLEGIAMAISKEVVDVVYPLFEDNYYGSGQDFWINYKSRENGFRNILDGRVWIDHNPSINEERRKKKIKMGYADGSIEQMGWMLNRLLGEDWPQELHHWYEFEQNLIHEIL